MSHQWTSILAIVCALSAPSALANEHLEVVNPDAMKERLAAGDYGTVTSVLISHRGKTVFETYLHGSDASSLHDTRSVTKTITGIAAGIAVKTGSLNIGEPIARHFADITPFANDDPRKLSITAEDLLTMSSPLECDDWNQHSRGNEEKMYIIEDWPRFFWNLPIRGYPAWAPKTRSAPHDRAFSYCTAGVQMLGETVERASQQPFTDLVEQRLFSPLEIAAFEWPRNGQGQAHMGGGLRLTTQGLAKIAGLFARPMAQSVLSADWIERSLRPHTRIPNGDWEYGYLWWLQRWQVGDAAVEVAAMNGNGGNRVVVIPQHELVIVITKTDFNTAGMHQKTDAFFEQQIMPLLARLSQN